ncbi:MAG: tetratricopeptide repeat protein [Bacteroidota bacterium]
MDWHGYNKGHGAYQQADCAKAIRYFDSVIDGWRLADMGQFVAHAQQQKSECIPFQAAVDKQQAGEMPAAILAYLGFLDQYQNSILAGAARSRIASMFESSEPSTLASQETCGIIDRLLGGNLIPQPGTHLPPFYLACGRLYEAAEDWQSSSSMYKAILISYPSHLLAPQAEKSLIENPVSCDEFEALKNSVIGQRIDFMPSLYFHCGQTYERNENWEKAIAAYETLLAEYPTHAYAPDAEVGLVHAIVTISQSNSAGEIPPPEVSGTTGNDLSEVIIQNSSPERLRIVFSGPESRVEELEACSSCATYTGTGPLFCPEQGPQGSYTLAPGPYDVVVESISDSGVTPWTGNWNLTSGDAYSTCIFLVTQILQ